MTQYKPCPKPHPLKTSGGASSVAEPVPNTLQPSTSTLVTQPKPHPQKHHPLNQSGVPSTNPVDGAACDSKDDDSDGFFIVSHVHDSLLEKSDTSSESFVPEAPVRRDENTPSSPMQQHLRLVGDPQPQCAHTQRGILRLSFQSA